MVLTASGCYSSREIYSVNTVSRKPLVFEPLVLGTKKRVVMYRDGEGLPWWLRLWLINEMEKDGIPAGDSWP